MELASFGADRQVVRRERQGAIEVRQRSGLVSELQFRFAAVAYGESEEFLVGMSRMDLRSALADAHWEPSSSLSTFNRTRLL